MPEPTHRRSCEAIHPDPKATEGVCRNCWHAVNSFHMQALWGLPLTAPRPQKPTRQRVSLTVNTVPCIHRGNTVPPPDRKPTSKTWFHCEHPEQPLGASVCVCAGCGPKCRGYEREPDAEWANSATRPPDALAAVARTSDPAVGVVIGSYRWPELVDLQCRVIRATCGPVPILVSSDHPESHTALTAICATHRDVMLWANPERIGHTGGDVSCFYKAVSWGASRGLSAVAKLSQRFFITRERWLQDSAADLLASGLPMATRTCRGVERFDLRTEACLVDVAQWNNPAVLDRIKPRRYWTDSPHGLTAETILYRVLQDLLGGVYWPWGLFSEERYERQSEVIWHTADGIGTYRALATAHGTTLPTDFTCDGWQWEHKQGKYLYG